MLRKLVPERSDCETLVLSKPTGQYLESEYSRLRSNVTQVADRQHKSIRRFAFRSHRILRQEQAATPILENR